MPRWYPSSYLSTPATLPTHSVTSEREWVPFSDDDMIRRFVRDEPYATEFNCPQWLGGITDAGAAVLAQDRTRDTAMVCRDIWQKLEDNGVPLRGEVILLIKQFILSPNFETIRGAFSELSEGVVIDLVLKCPRLMQLELDSSQITDAGAIQIANNCPNLTIIVLADTAITDAGIITIADKCHKLEWIDFKLTRITDIGVTEIANKCPEVTDIILSGTKVTDVGITEIANNCSNLELIFLNETEITYVCIMELIKKCPKLKTMDLRSNCLFDSSDEYIIDEDKLETIKNMRVPWSRQEPDGLAIDW